MNERLPKAE